MLKIWSSGLYVNKRRKVTTAKVYWLQNEVKAINANKKHLKDATLDMDAAKTRYQNIIRQTQSTGNPKLDTMKDEVDEASQKVEQARDLFVTDLYNFIAKEPEHSKLLLQVCWTIGSAIYVLVEQYSHFKLFKY